MSKGSKRRPGQQFSENFDRIEWKRNSDPVEIPIPGGTKYVYGELPETRQVHHIMPDIEPYQAVAGDVALKGDKPVITSRSRHREFLKRNNYDEVGTEKEYFFKHNGKTPDNPTREW